MSALNDINNYANDSINGQQVFSQKYHAFAASIYWKNANNDKLESSDKIVLPPSALSKLSSMKILNTIQKDKPIIFEIANDSDILPKKSHCSVIEFTANNGCCYLPLQMMNNLGLDYHGKDRIALTTVNLPNGELVQVQAHNTQKIMNLSSNIPKYILEKSLTKYSCLTLGDTIQIEYDGNIYKFDITKVKPSIIHSLAPPAVSIIVCDIEIDFKEPRDYKQWKERNNIGMDGDDEDQHLDYFQSHDNDHNESKSDDLDTSDYSNDDPIASPDYFQLYGKSAPSPECSNSSEQSEYSSFSFKDANKGFSFCDDKKKKKNKENEDKDKN